MKRVEGLRLYATPDSVYSTKVRLALALKGLTWSELPPPGGYGSVEYRCIVPQGTVPALDHGGFVLSESDAIIEYLEDIGAGRPLLPADPRARARTRALSRFVDTQLEPAARALFPSVGTGPAPAGTGNTIARHLDTLGTMAGPGPFLIGEAPTLPDCGLWAVQAVLRMLDASLNLGLNLAALDSSGRTLDDVSTILNEYDVKLDVWARARDSNA